VWVVETPLVGFPKAIASPVDRQLVVAIAPLRRGLSAEILRATADMLKRNPFATFKIVGLAIVGILDSLNRSLTGNIHRIYCDWRC
jgi:hypothetical protein